jgi:maltose O-acetyltransferase
MRTEREKMLAGELYLSGDPELREARLRCRRLLHRLNHMEPGSEAERLRICHELFGSFGEHSWIEPSFRCDYGTNIRFGRTFYANFDCVILDCAEVVIGDDVMFAPGVHIYTATHPLAAAERCSGAELARPVHIGHRAWLGGRVVVLPGVTIGDEAVIGAGSVVARDIPPGVLAVGNPCRVVRPIAKSG